MNLILQLMSLKKIGVLLATTFVVSEGLDAQSEYLDLNSRADESSSYISKKASFILNKENNDIDYLAEELFYELIKIESDTCECIKKYKWTPKDEKIDEAEWTIKNVTEMTDTPILRFYKKYTKKSEYITLSKKNNEWEISVTIIDGMNNKSITQKIYNKYSSKTKEYINELKILFKDYKLSTNKYIEEIYITDENSAKF